MSKTVTIKCDACRKEIEDINRIPFKLTLSYWFEPKHSYIQSSAELCRSCGDRLQSFLLFGNKLK